MADTQTLSDPFKLPKGNADTSGKIPGQKDYNKNSQTKNTYKIDIPTRAGQTTGANENNPVAVYRVGVTQPIGTITSQSGFTPNPTYYSGVSAAEEKIRKAEQRAVREQTVEINKQVIKPTAEKAKIKPPIKNNDAATDSQKTTPAADKTTPAAAQSADTGKAVTGTKTSGFGTFIYPEDLGSTKQDVIKFTMLEYLPSKEIKGGKEGGDNILNLGRDPKAKDRKGIGTVVLPIPAGISDTNTCNWQGGDLDALKGAVAAAAMSGITQGLGAMAGAIGKGFEDAIKDPNTKTATATGFAAAAAGGDGAALLARTEGIVINPNMELLFNGPTLRPFSFIFKMSARSAKEALQIISILNFFKRGMSPIKSQSNLFLKAPHTFRIQYLDRRGKDSRDKDTDHPYIGRIKECALQSVVVSYTPHGEYATYTNGVMVSYEMQMQFQELEPIFNNDYEGLPGIGY